MQNNFLKVKEYVEKEPYVRLLGIKLLELKEGYSLVEMKASKDFENIFSITHGGAIFSLADVAFGAAANSYGKVAVAISININYLRPSRSGETLRAEAREISRGRKIATYEIDVSNNEGKKIATSQATAFLKGEKIDL